MEECNIVSLQGRVKVVVKGYLMIKDLFYWNCDQKVIHNCKRIASTILIDGRHVAVR